MPSDDPTHEADRLAPDYAARLLDTAGVIVLVLDPRGAIVSFNRHMERLGGYALAEVVGRDWFEVFIPEPDRAGLRELFARAVAGEPVVGNVNPILTKHGELRTIEWHANAVPDDDGRVLGLINVGMDITDKLEMQAKLVDAERLAAIGMLASVFAHEVGNPLNAMYLQAQLLRRRIDRPVEGLSLAAKVDVMLGEIQRLTALLDDFRSFQRPEAPRLEPTDVNAVLSDVIETLAVKAEATDVTIVAELADELPRVAGHANKLKQVFINLCKNAIEAMPDGGALHLVSRRGELQVEVEVRDTGRGIPEDLDVFAPFATSKPAGMGLGLALVREIVSLHAGEVGFQSSPEGTTFTVKLPILPA